jgi:hypothetical protein
VDPTTLLIVYANHSGIPLKPITTLSIQDCVYTLIYELGEHNNRMLQAHAQLQLQHQVDITVHNQTCEKYQKEIQYHQALQRRYETESATHIITQAQHIELNTTFTNLIGVVDNLYA